MSEKSMPAPVLNEIKLQPGERILLSAFALLGLSSMGLIVGGMSFAMRFLPGW